MPQVETLKYLIEKRKADVNAVDADSQNLLHLIACFYEEQPAKRCVGKCTTHTHRIHTAHTQTRT